MPRLIDANELLKHAYDSGLWKDAEKGFHQRVVDVEVIADAPTVDVVPLEDYRSMERTVNKLTEALADAVEVVRCKDCWVFHQDETRNPKAGLCGWFDMPVGVNDFCSMGDRREDAKTD